VGLHFNDMRWEVNAFLDKYISSAGILNNRYILPKKHTFTARKSTIYRQIPHPTVGTVSQNRLTI
jgi:hypothetical protein